MNEHKSFIVELAELIDRHLPRRRQQADNVSQPNRWQRILRWFLPNGGTLLLVAALVLTANAWARPLLSPASAPGPSATTVNYQGRLADHSGNPLDGTYGMAFSLWDATTGGNLVWGPESHAAVPVSQGLFSVGLGSQTSGGIPTSVWNGDRYLQIAVGGETLTPRELIRSVPIAGLALTVPDGAVTVAKLSPTAAGKWTMLAYGQEVVLRSGGGSFDWQVVDLSASVPATAKIAYVKIYAKETGGNAWCSVRPYGSTSAAGIEMHTPVANVYNTGTALVALNSSRFEYRCGLQSGATISDMGIELWGYYEPGY